MTWLALIEALVIGLLGLLVVALAHSYAGLAARVRALDDAPSEVRTTRARAVGVPDRDRAGDRDGDLAVDGPDGPLLEVLEGVSPHGELVHLAVRGAARDTLLAFLTTTCASCRGLWDELAPAAERVPIDVRLVVVAKGPAHESVSEVAARAASAGDVQVVLSSETWAHCSVPGSPYFVLLSREDGAALGEGTARSWSQALALMGVSEADAGLSSRGVGASRVDRRRAAAVDRVLVRAGVLPGDPSLYPAADEGAPTS